MEALAESNLTLARTNEVLVQRLAEHDQLKSANDSLRAANAALLHELEQVRADNTALEQEMHLGVVQRSTRRAKIYVSFVPFAVSIVTFFICIILMFCSMASYLDVPAFVYATADRIRGLGVTRTLMISALLTCGADGSGPPTQRRSSCSS